MDVLADARMNSLARPGGSSGARPAGRPVSLQPAGVRPLLACADDLGVDARTDAIVLRLVAAGRLSGASLLVDGPRAAAAARDAVAAAPDRLGLHLNLTQSFGQPFAVRPVARWLLDAARGRLAREGALRAALAAEIARQCERFCDLAGQPPAYVDGHEHVHGLRGVHDLIATALVRIASTPIPLRDVRPRRWRGLKAQVIGSFCGHRAGPALNDDFIGVYALDAARPYGERLARWLGDLAADRPLLVCHPGDAAGSLPHGAARAAEAAYLGSSHWPALLSRCGFTLAAPAAMPVVPAGGARQDPLGSP